MDKKLDERLIRVFELEPEKKSKRYFKKNTDWFNKIKDAEYQLKQIGVVPHKFTKIHWKLHNFEFWPTTGRWIKVYSVNGNLKKFTKGFGLDNLIIELKNMKLNNNHQIVKTSRKVIKKRNQQRVFHQFKSIKAVLPNDTDKPITRKEAFDLIKAFEAKGMSMQWIKDTMLVLWKIEKSLDLKRWHFEKIWKLLSSVKNAQEYRNLLIEVDIGK